MPGIQLCLRTDIKLPESIVSIKKDELEQMISFSNIDGKYRKVYDKEGAPVMIKKGKHYRYLTPEGELLLPVHYSVYLDNILRRGVGIRFKCNVYSSTLNVWDQTGFCIWEHYKVDYLAFIEYKTHVKEKLKEACLLLGYKIEDKDITYYSSVWNDKG